jgi:hypothetical protein
LIPDPAGKLNLSALLSPGSTMVESIQLPGF